MGSEFCRARSCNLRSLEEIPRLDEEETTIGTLYLKATPEQIARRVVLVGDPERLDRARELLETVEHDGQNREFSWITGRYRPDTRRVSVVACGIGAPAWAIVLTELVQCGAQFLVRLGTALSPVRPLGRVALSGSVLRCDRVSTDYIPPDVPVFGDEELLGLLEEELESSTLSGGKALFASFSTFYGEMEPLPEPLLGPEKDGLAGLKQTGFDRALQYGAEAVDMETGLVLALAQRFGVAGISACLCTVSGRGGPSLETERKHELENELIEVVFRALSS